MREYDKVERVCGRERERPPITGGPYMCSTPVMGSPLLGFVCAPKHRRSRERECVCVTEGERDRERECVRESE